MEGVDRKIFCFIKEEIIFVVFALVWTSVGAHAMSKQQIFATPSWSQQSRQHPCCCGDFWTKRKIPQHAEFHFHKRFTQKGVFGWSSEQLKEDSRGVSRRPVASPGPVFTSDGRIRRQPCGRCGSNPRCLRIASAPLEEEQRPEGTRGTLEAVTLRFSDSRARCPLPC